MWKVTHEFKEVKHDGHIYKVGDVYPAEGFEADAERVAFLQKNHEQYGVSFLEETEEEEPKEEEPKEDVQITAVEEPEQEPEQAQETQEQPEGMETAQEQAPAKAKRAPRTKKTSSDAKGDE